VPEPPAGIDPLADFPAERSFANVRSANPGKHIPHINTAAEIKVGRFQKFLLLPLEAVESTVFSCLIFSALVTADFTFLALGLKGRMLAENEVPAHQGGSHCGLQPSYKEATKRATILLQGFIGDCADHTGHVRVGGLSLNRHSAH
jgi:hypothetical protein